MSYGVLSHRQYGFFMSIQMMWVVPANDAGFFVSCRPCCGRSAFHQCLCCCVFHRGGESLANAFRASSGLPRRSERRMARAVHISVRTKHDGNRQDIGNACRWLGCLSCRSACGRIIRHIRPDAPVSSGCRCCRACVSWLQCRARWQRGGRSLPSGRHSPN